MTIRLIAIIVVFILLASIGVWWASEVSRVDFLSQGDPVPSDAGTGGRFGFLPSSEKREQSCNALFVVIGDYGQAGQNEADVAALVDSWEPDFVTTVGDNNYPNGAAATIDENVGQYYHEYISPYTGAYGEGADVNRFFPALGNHDWHAAGAQPYLDYFALPGNERYYEKEWGPVHLFVLDSSVTEPDGITSRSKQAQWLRREMQASDLPWQVVVLHHAPYSSASNHGSDERLQWPYEDWGADLVLSGHDHVYERLEVDGLTYIVNGLGGGAVYGFGQALPYSEARYRADYGALRILASKDELRGAFYTVDGDRVDVFILSSPSGRECGPNQP